MNSTLYAGLKQIINLNYGKALKRNDRKGGIYPVYGSNGIVGFHDKYLIKEPTIIIGRKGSVGALSYCESASWPIDTAYSVEVLDQKKVDLKYLFYALQSLDISDIVQKGVKPGINRSDYLSKKIFLPTIGEQKRIVKKLDEGLEKIATVIQKNEDNIEKIDKLLEVYTQQIFQDLEKTHKSLNIKEVSENIQYGYTGNRKVVGKYKYLRITDIQNGKVVWENVPYSDIRESEAKKYLLHQGDIVFARSGATSGKSFLIEKAENAIFASYLIRVICNKKTITPDYLYTFFQSPQYWQQVSEKVSGAAQPNVNGQKLASIQLPMPPLNIQEKTVRKIRELSEKISIYKDIKSRDLISLEKLQQSLLNSVFQKS